MQKLQLHSQNQYVSGCLTREIIMNAGGIVQDTNVPVETPQWLARALESSFEGLCTTLDLLAPHERENPGMDGGWSPKVELAHVAFWDEFQTARMQAALAGRSVKGYPRPDHDNDARAQADANRDWEEVLASARQARQRMVDFADHLEPDVLTQEFPEGERVFFVGHQLRHMVRHTSMHERPIRRFCGSMQRWARPELRAYLIAQHTCLLESVLELPQSTIAETPVCGQWTPRDVLAHVLSWNEHADHLIDGWPAPEPARVAEWQGVEAMDMLNERLMAARVGLELDEIVTRLRKCHARLIAAYDAASDMELSEVGETWRGTEALSLQFYEVAVHEREHTADILRLQADL